MRFTPLFTFSEIDPANCFFCIFLHVGVAFEQGKTLPTPETVPFRLTRDIVDGMGVAGVEGVFRRCCEKTMEVMRASHEELRTIVEVGLCEFQRLQWSWDLKMCPY